ncbi:hypothetical protein LCGC14_1648080 [marine sediment metagenome]|uniref:Uncharacterized protein n=1 Tax=marine sediment metagenome TaxID=412755 RepID=A0A0F9HYH0_9ZZZZ
MTPQNSNEDPEAQVNGTNGGGAESPPAGVQNGELPGAAAELNSGAVNVSLPDGATAEGHNDPTRPAAASATTKPPGFGDHKASTGSNRGSIEEQDRQERLEKKAPPKVRNPLNEAVGSEFYVTSDTKPSWTYPRGGQFRVSRHYVHSKVAVDFLDRSNQAADEAVLKREVLNVQGIVYISIGPREAFTTEEMQDMIENQRATIAKGDPNAAT